MSSHHQRSTHRSPPSQSVTATATATVAHHLVPSSLDSKENEVISNSGSSEKNKYGHNIEVGSVTNPKKQRQSTQQQQQQQHHYRFRQRSSRADWSKISSLDINSIIERNDVTILQAILDDVVFWDISDRSLRDVPTEYVVKLVCILQLISEYQLKSQEDQYSMLFESFNKQKQLKSLVKKLEKDSIILKEDCSLYQRQLALIRGSLSSTQSMLLVKYNNSSSSSFATSNNATSTTTDYSKLAEKDALNAVNSDMLNYEMNERHMTNKHLLSEIEAIMNKNFSELQNKVAKDPSANTRDGKVKNESYEVGDRVKGNYRGQGSWYPGKIDSADVEGNRYGILYDDGEKETNVASTCIHPVDHANHNAVDDPNSLLTDKINDAISKGLSSIESLLSSQFAGMKQQHSHFSTDDASAAGKIDGIQLSSSDNNSNSSNSSAKDRFAELSVREEAIVSKESYQNKRELSLNEREKLLDSREECLLLKENEFAAMKLIWESSNGSETNKSASADSTSLGDNSNNNSNNSNSGNYSNNNESASKTKEDDFMPMDNHLSIVDHLNSKLEDFKGKIMSLTLQSHLHSVKLKTFKKWERTAMDQKLKTALLWNETKSKELVEKEAKEKDFASKMKDERHNLLIEKAKLKSENKKIKTELDQHKLAYNALLTEEKPKVSSQHEIGVGTSIDFSRIRGNLPSSRDVVEDNYSDNGSDISTENGSGGSHVAHWLHNLSGSEEELMDLVESDFITRRNVNMLPKSRQEIASTLASDIMAKLQQRI